MAITPLSLVFPKVNQRFVRYLTAHGENRVWDLFHRSLVSYFLKSPAFGLTQFVQVKENVRLTGIGPFTFGLFIQCLISLIFRADQTWVLLWACRFGVKHLPGQAVRQAMHPSAVPVPEPQDSALDKTTPKPSGTSWQHRLGRGFAAGHKPGPLGLPIPPYPTKVIWLGTVSLGVPPEVSKGIIQRQRDVCWIILCSKGRGVMYWVPWVMYFPGSQLHQDMQGTALA